MHRDVSAVLERVRSLETDDIYEADRRALFHAYIACLSLPDLCLAIAQTLDASVRVRLAMRRRLLRLLGPGLDDYSPVVGLVEGTAGSSDRDLNLRRAADALHSAVFQYLPINAQQMLLERWIHRGGRGAMARWLKAVKEIESLFDATTALGYWRDTSDFRAAKALAYQAEPEFLRAVMPELAAACEEGWIIGRAISRCGGTTTEVWDAVRQSHPATYLYLCAKLARPVGDAEALELVHRCGSGVIHGDRGLAIWSIGQMGKADVLDRIVDGYEVLHRRDTEHWRRLVGQ
ncbi:hypothetical protein FQV39_32960 (plasmid) [Bosea sp. F3-2]|uniref:hypothetical protein n=1 Tax=Bosea sp. F3-2 TaxID=2599640 RepID=UPI0011ED8716|nr:hypothetical protein [Bosea sp. F3-2]QEL27415.1 hypothetical protein FQV39_32960 [Bosea sp. F3-2]